MNQNDLMFRRRLMIPLGVSFDKIKATFSVSGGMEDTTVTVDGVTYRLLKITKSGTLTLSKACSVSICLVGGGGNGAKGSGGGGGGGGGGGFMTHILNVDQAQNLVFSVGAATKATTVSGDAAGTANGGGTATGLGGGNGGSGGGLGGKASIAYNPGTGDGKSKYPFGIVSLLAHCAGGAGGNGLAEEYDDYGELLMSSKYKGGAGGTNGGSGGRFTTTSAPGGDVAKGGEYGGGDGGVIIYTAPNGQAGSFYGAGGGGGAGYELYSEYYPDSFNGAGGSGYQGVAYVIDGSFPANV